MKQLLIVFALILFTATQGFAQSAEDQPNKEQQKETTEHKNEDTSKQEKKSSIRYIEETEIFLMPETDVEIA